MPLDETNKLKSYDEIIADRIAKWERESTAQIAKEVGEIGRMNESEVKRYSPKKAADKIWRGIAAALTVMSVVSVREVKKMYKAGFEEWDEKTEYLYKHRGIEQKQVDASTINNYVRQTMQDLSNFTDTKALCVIGRNDEVIRFQDEIYKAFSDAVGVVMDGEDDFYATMRKTICRFGSGGVRVNYGNGVTRRLDTVVRQNLLYGIKKANIEYSDRIAKELDCDGYEIDAHNNSRDSHLFMQGKQYCIGEGRTIKDTYFVGFEETDPESTDGLSASEALNDYGCRHYRTPIICGVSEPRFTKEQLQKIKDDNTREHEIDGKKGNRYFWEQKMRAIETEIRKAKDEINVLKAFGNSEPQLRNLRSRIRMLQSKYDEISETTGIDKEPKRMQVSKSSR